MNLLDTCTVCLLKGKRPELMDIFIENEIFAIFCPANNPSSIKLDLFFITFDLAYHATVVPDSVKKVNLNSGCLVIFSLICIEFEKDEQRLYTCI